MGPFIKLYSGDFDESTAILEKDFADAGASKREAMTAILLTEELFARMAPRSGDCVDAEVKRHWGDVTLRLSSEGDALNPLSDSPFPENDEQDRLRGLLLRANRDKLSYSRRGTRNIVTVSVHLAADKQMKYTLAAMLLGIVFGLACKALLPETALAFLNGSILGNIRTVFLNALKMMIAPLILFSVLSSVSGMSGASEVGRSGARVLLFYLLTSIVACFLGAGLFYLFFGASAPALPPEWSAARAVEATDVDLASLLTGIVPSNLASPVLNMDVLQILFVSILFGVVLNALRDRTPMLVRLADEGNTFCIRVVSLIVRFLPLVAFASMASLVIKVGLSTLKTLGVILLGHILGVAVMLLVYATLLTLIGRVSPLPFLRKAPGFMTIPFSLASSNACIPFTLDFCVSKLGVPKKLAAFSVPIGSTVNMDGGCFSIVFQGLLLAKMYGVVITPSLLVTTILTAILLSVGAPGVAGSAFICLTTIVVSLGCPAELATFVLGIDSLLSMLRISNNVIGDTAAACAVAAAEKQLDLSVYTGRR